MTENITVDNLKCGGCASTIKNSLIKMEGVEDISVDVETSNIRIEFSGTLTRTDLVKKLGNLGYPKEGTTNTYQKAKSYVSCAIGNVNS
jgi:copper chaperone CopZ